MEDFYAAKATALQCIRQIQAKLIQDDPQTYDKFKHVLKQFGSRKIDPSTVINTVHNLFDKYPDLIVAFHTFLPANHSGTTFLSSAAAADDDDEDDFRACVGFLKRVSSRFNGGAVYRKLLVFLASHYRGEISILEACDKAVSLLGKNYDLAAEFKSFLPEYSSDVQETTYKKRKISPTSEEVKDQEPLKKIDIKDQEPVKKIKITIKFNHNNNPNIRAEETPAAAAPPRRSARRLTKNSRYYEVEKEKNANAIFSKDEIFDMEDDMSFVDVQISNLNSVYANADALVHRFYSGTLSPADVHLDEHFTALNLAFIRSIDKEFLKTNHNDNGNLWSAISTLKNRLKKKKHALEKARAKLTKKWLKMGRSRS